MPYSVAQLLIPGLSSYRPVWVGVGIVAFYLVLLVTVTFYLRGKIGQKAFRTIHVFSLVAFLATAIHGQLSGTDASLPAVQAMYAGTFLSVVFLTAYWLITLRMKKKASAHSVLKRAVAPPSTTKAWPVIKED
jgi:predicted ferric reductase